MKKSFAYGTAFLAVLICNVYFAGFDPVALLFSYTWAGYGILLHHYVTRVL